MDGPYGNERKYWKMATSSVRWTLQLSLSKKSHTRWKEFLSGAAAWSPNVVAKALRNLVMDPKTCQCVMIHFLSGSVNFPCLGGDGGGEGGGEEESESNSDSDSDEDEEEEGGGVGGGAFDGPGRGELDLRRRRGGRRRLRFRNPARIMDKRVHLKINGNRAVEGILRGFDPFMNLILDETIEFTKAGEENVIGMTVIRGNSESSIRVEIDGQGNKRGDSYSIRSGRREGRHEGKERERVRERSFFAISAAAFSQMGKEGREEKTDRPTDKRLISDSQQHSPFGKAEKG